MMDLSSLEKIIKQIGKEGSEHENETPYGTPPEESPENLSCSEEEWFNSTDSSLPYLSEGNETPQVSDVTEIQELKNDGKGLTTTSLERLVEIGGSTQPRKLPLSKSLSLPYQLDELRSCQAGDVKTSCESFHDQILHPKRQGKLLVTKLEDGRKRLKKQWSSHHVVLTDVMLLCYKDVQSTALGLWGSKADSFINLAGAVISWCPDKSSKKNVFRLTTLLGQTLLFQDDSDQTSTDWYRDIHSAISMLPSPENIKSGEKSLNNDGINENLKSDLRRKNRFLSCRSPKFDHLKNAHGAFFNSFGDRNRIHNKLLQFFHKRPSIENLKRKGILKDEPVFGYSLQSLCEREKTNIPKFVLKCIAQIELFDLNTDGLYRVSGNLAQVQKLRLRVDQDDYSVLETVDDVHILTGALKLFFREMREPLIPVSCFLQIMDVLGKQTMNKKMTSIKEIIHSLPEANYETLKFLISHLLRVEKCREKNLMDIQNLAIVFGPTLMSSDSDLVNMALDVLHQNRVLEYLLLEFHQIFSSSRIS